MLQQLQLQCATAAHIEVGRLANSVYGLLTNLV